MDYNGCLVAVDPGSNRRAPSLPPSVPSRPPPPGPARGARDRRDANVVNNIVSRRPCDKNRIWISIRRTWADNRRCDFLPLHTYGRLRRATKRTQYTVCTRVRRVSRNRVQTKYASTVHTGGSWPVLTCKTRTTVYSVIESFFTYNLIYCTHAHCLMC